MPCELVRDVLPKGLAEELLVLLLAESPGWQRGQWTMFGKTHAAPRTSCYYSLDADAVGLYMLKCTARTVVHLQFYIPCCAK